MSEALRGASLVAPTIAEPALAETTGPQADAITPLPGAIVVTAPVLRTKEDVLQRVSIVTREELTRELRPTIGETLARQPGVSATSFAPSASRPVLRGH